MIFHRVPSTAWPFLVMWPDFVSAISSLFLDSLHSLSESFRQSSLQAYTPKLDGLLSLASFSPDCPYSSVSNFTRIFSSSTAAHISIAHKSGSKDHCFAKSSLWSRTHWSTLTKTLKGPYSSDFISFEKICMYSVSSKVHFSLRSPDQC